MPFTNNELETILYTLEGYMMGNDDDKLCDELSVICDKIVKELPPKCESNNKSNVTYNEVDYVEQCITEGHDYRDCVDTLVGNMGSNDDNGTVYNTTLSEENKKEWLYDYSHDSEGC